MRRMLGLVLAGAGVLAAGVNEDLLAAARKGDAAGVMSLLEEGADVEAKTPYGQTPLYVAAIGGHEEAVRVLLGKGAKVEVSDTFYKAPMLAFVIQRKHFGVAKILIEKGESVDNGLEGAVRSQRLDLVQAALARKGASQAALDRMYEMVLDAKQAEIGEALKAAGAKPPAVVDVDAAVLASYAGLYKAEQGMPDLTVTVKQDKLTLQATGQQPLPLKTRSATLFEFAPAGIKITFDGAGSLRLDQGGRTFTFKKAVAQ